MAPNKRSRLFDGITVAPRCMVVDRSTLAVKPVVDQFFRAITGSDAPGVPRGEMQWTSALADHVVSIEPVKGVRSPRTLERKMNAEVRALNAGLARYDAMLLPTAAHPFMDPAAETVLWPGQGREVYATYDRVLGCRQHGWSNSQSLRLDLPFGTDEEFTKLHAAVRLVLPIVPALCASSPLLQGVAAEALDARLLSWEQRAAKVPELAGPIIPEAVFSQEDYYREIFAPIGKALAGVDQRSVLDHLSANARVAVARFDRGVISVRAIDAQECVGADLAVAEVVTAVVKAMVQGRWVSTYLQRAWSETDLGAIYRRTLKDGLKAVINDKDYLLMFGVLREGKMTARELWAHLLEQTRTGLSEHVLLHGSSILKNGNVAERILKRTGRKPSREKIVQVYRELAACLAEDRVFG